jgi:phenylalanine-4-hydroxylase
MEILQGRAESEFFNSCKRIGFSREEIPHFDKVNKALQEISGWNLEVVPGLIPNKPFYTLLANRHFPASTWFRRMDELDYLEEPDMFHDVFGHIPMLTNPDFVEFLRQFSEIALGYLENEWAVQMIARIYWFTVEFGLINTPEGLRIYGAGILSSGGESVYSLGDVPQHVPYDVETIALQSFYIDRFQEKYFVIDSYRQLYESLPEIARVLAKYANTPINA